MQKCTLCHSYSENYFNTDFLKCTNCFSVFRNPKLYLSANDEKRRYDLHQNDVNDTGYLEFISPIVKAIKNNFTSDNIGLDFGAGPSSGISYLLKKEKYNIEEYDPFYSNNKLLLEKKYDYIACCEVMEHFHSPDKEFQLLKKILLPQRKLFCKTSLIDDSIDFKTWYYKNDATHVFFYSQKALEFIKEKFEFDDLEVKDELITFTNS